MNIFPDQILQELNPAQRDAVIHTTGPLMILAGAGTGKTMTLTKRVAHLVLSGRAKPSEILALTFTEKSAGEMQERVEKFVGQSAEDITIGTFHEFCGQVLRERGYEIGIDPSFRILTELESWLFIHCNLFRFSLQHFRPLGNPTKFIGLLQKFFSKLKEEGVSPTEFKEFVVAGKVSEGIADLDPAAQTEMDEKYLELAEAYIVYEDLMHTAGNLDFADLIYHTLRLFSERTSVLDEYQRKFRYVLVDEFQDTNHSQNEIVKLLCAKHQNLTVVGDDDQAIYRFRGASLSNILGFRMTYPEAKQVVLTENYRSSQEILDRSHDLIQHNDPDRLEAREQLDKKLISQLQFAPSETATAIHKFHNAREEAEWVVSQISESADYSSVAILARANNHLQIFADTLEKMGIPFQTTSEEGLLTTPEVRDLLSILRLMLNPRDTLSCFRFLHLPVFFLPASDILSLMVHAREYSRHLYSVVSAAAEGKLDYISEETQAKLKNITNLIASAIKHSKDHTAGETLSKIMEDIGLYEYFQSKNLHQSNQRITRFMNLVQDFEERSADQKIPHLLEYLDLLTESGSEDQSARAVTGDSVVLSTVHSAKGLEWDTVYMVNLVEQRFPAIDRREPLPIPEALVQERFSSDKPHEQEERRLFYVAMTRARRQLHLTYAEFYGEGKRTRKPSRFLTETGIEDA